MLSRHTRKQLARLLLWLVCSAHILYTPYTKVEESWTLHTIHDIHHYGLTREALAQVRLSPAPSALLRCHPWRHIESMSISSLALAVRSCGASMPCSQKLCRTSRALCSRLVARQVPCPSPCTLVWAQAGRTDRRSVLKRCCCRSEAYAFRRLT